MLNIFISGGASGLGKAFAQAYAAQNSRHTIYVLDLGFSDAYFTEFEHGLEWARKHIVPISCDITNSSLLAQKLADIHCRLDLVIHSAGVRGLVPGVPLREYKDVATAESMDVMNADTMRKTFEVNTIGTFMLLRALLPLLPSSAESSAGAAKVVVMGSRLGSIGHNTQLGGAYAYRASKAALNAVVKSFSVEIPKVIWIVMHPGRVETKLVAIKEDNAMNAAQIVQELLPLIQGFIPSDTGRFVDRFGVDIPW